MFFVVVVVVVYVQCRPQSALHIVHKKKEKQKMRVLRRGYKAESCFTWRCAPCRVAGAREREIEDRRVSCTVQRPIRVDPGVGQDLAAHHLSIDVAGASGCSPWAVGCCSSTVRLRCCGWIR